MNDEKDLATVSQSGMALMDRLSSDTYSEDDVKLLTSDKQYDQLKVFLIAQAKNELERVVRLTKLLDNLESSFIDEINTHIANQDLTLRMYSELMATIVQILDHSNEVVSRVLNDDKLSMIISTTISADNKPESREASIISQLKDPQSRERVRTIVEQVIARATQYANSNPVQTVEFTDKTEKPKRKYTKRKNKESEDNNG